MAPIPVHIPYCGLPPDPGDLWSRWNLDPRLAFILILIAALYAVAAPAARRHGVVGRRNEAAFYLGWTILTAALMSPLCPLSVSLFAARVGQHMIIVLIAVPLIAAGRPLALAAAPFQRRRPQARPSRILANALCASAAFTVTLWFWHMPAPYAATFASDTVYWLMHITMILSAFWLWTVLFDRRIAQAVTVIAAGLINSTQMSLLGAAITFASTPLYTPHAHTTVAWGMSQLLDQQLGGAIMWVPGGVIFLVAAMVSLWSLVATRERVLLGAEPR